MTADLSRSSLSNDLAQAVVSMVHERGLAAGDPLESLKDLAARFRVAVPTMREALRRLEGLGMIEFRHGSGTYVGINTGHRLLANPVVPPPEAEQLVELLEARQQIEPSIAAMAATVRDSAGLAELTASLRQAREYIDTDHPDLWRVNLDLHRAVAAASGNRILTDLQHSMAMLYSHQQREILRLHGGAEEDYREHEQIVAHIVNGDAAAAEAATREHLRHTLDIIRQGAAG